MLEACRTCLRLIDMDNLPFYDIEDFNVELSAESCRYKLLSVIPEMALDITPKSKLCVECHKSLEAMYEFKAKCLKTENVITQYLRAKPDVDIKNLDLKDVSAFNAANMNIIKVEASFEDEAVKEEVELSETVITNVKREVDDFSTESVALPLLSSNYTCEYCGKRCRNSSSLEIHLCTHTGEKPYRCGICDHRFGSKKGLTIHLRRHTGEWPYVCSICYKGCPSNSVLTAHMRSHTGEKPHRCKICNHCFAQKSQLKTHLQTHTGEKPYRCEMCDHCFAQKSHLTVHLRTHTGERPYVCTVCSKGFSSNSELTIHMRTHTGEKPYRCEICDKGFSKRFNLKEHTRTHGKRQRDQYKKNSSLVIHRSKNFQCEHCKELFWHKQHLQRHITTVHKEVDVDTIVIKRENATFIDHKETQISIPLPSGP